MRTELDGKQNPSIYNRASAGTPRRAPYRRGSCSFLSGDGDISGKLEKYGVITALIVYLAFQVNAAFHHGFRGQDFQYNQAAVIRAGDHPLWFLTRVNNALVNEPPLYFLLCGELVNLTDGKYYLEVIAILSAAVNALAFLLLYKLMRHSVANGLLRLSCLIFLLFLPCLMIHTLVLSSDAVTFPLFVGEYYFFFRLAQSGREHTRAAWLCAAGLWIFLAAGISTKFTFVSQTLAAILGFCILNRVGLPRKRIAIGAIALSALLLAACVLSIRRYAGTLALGERRLSMSVRDIVFFHKADLHVFRAPAYNEPVRGRPSVSRSAEPFELQQQHKYSYPALLHLGVFTDVMNIYQDDPNGIYFSRRSPKHTARMRLAVKTGVVFSLTFLILTPIAIARGLHRGVIKRQSSETMWAILAVCALGWFLNIVVFFPYVPTYAGGYWLPRLITPALVSFVVLSTWLADQFVRRRSRVWPMLICLLVVCQSLIHLSFLWPWT